MTFAQIFTFFRQILPTSKRWLYTAYIYKRFFSVFWTLYLLLRNILILRRIHCTLKKLFLYKMKAPSNWIFTIIDISNLRYLSNAHVSHHSCGAAVTVSSGHFHRSRRNSSPAKNPFLSLPRRRRGAAKSARICGRIGSRPKMPNVRTPPALAPQRHRDPPGHPPTGVRRGGAARRTDRKGVRPLTSPIFIYRRHRVISGGFWNRGKGETPEIHILKLCVVDWAFWESVCLYFGTYVTALCWKFGREDFGMVKQPLPFTKR